MILGSALTAVLSDRVNLILLYFLSIFGTALALAGTGVSPTFALALGALAVAGIFNGIDNVVTDTILQKRVPGTFLGRVRAQTRLQDRTLGVRERTHEDRFSHAPEDNPSPTVSSEHALGQR